LEFIGYEEIPLLPSLIGISLSHRFAFQFDLVRIMDQPGEGNRPIANEMNLLKNTVKKYRRLVEKHGFLDPGNPFAVPRRTRARDESPLVSQAHALHGRAV